MHTQPLFLDQPLAFQKVAGAMTHLSDDSNKWEQEIMQEAYRQLPYLSDFEIHVVLDRVDEERGYAFGSIEVQPKSQMTYDERQERPVEKAHVPIVVREQALCPLDVFITNKQYRHLTEGRLRSSMFRADTFDAARTRPPEPSLYNDMQPPLGDGRMGGGGIKLAAYTPVAALKSSIQAAKAPAAGVAAKALKPTAQQNALAGKFISTMQAPTKPLQSASAIRGVKLAAQLPLLPQLHGQVLPEHLDRLKTAMQSPDLIASIVNHGEGTQAAFASALGLTPSMPEKTAQVVIDRIRPNVVQLQKLANGQVKVKWANTDMYQPQEAVVPPAEAQAMAGGPEQGQAVIGKLETNGTVTMSPDAAVKNTLDSEKIEVADQYGLWDVQDTMGNTLVGFVFPQLLSFDMQPLPLSLFSNGSQYALQQHIAGKLVGKSTDLPRGKPQGFGAFYYHDKGTARAFVPLTILHSFEVPGSGFSLAGQLETGEQVTFSFSKDLMVPTKVGEGEYCLPASFCWLPLKAHVELVPEPALFMKTANTSWNGTVEILGDDDVYSFRGPPLYKIAKAEYEFVKRAQAEWISTALGLTPGFTKEALDRASRGELLTVAGVRMLTPLTEKIAEAYVGIRKALAENPIRNYDLIKEAAILDDALTVDKVLSLGFLNAENVSTFVDMLPGLEQAASRIAEMLVASRLGMKDIPEVALERMMVAMEDVILGLRRLKQKSLTFSPHEI